MSEYSHHSTAISYYRGLLHSTTVEVWPSAGRFVSNVCPIMGFYTLNQAR